MFRKLHVYTPSASCPCSIDCQRLEDAEAWNKAHSQASYGRCGRWGRCGRCAHAETGVLRLRSASHFSLKSGVCAQKGHLPWRM
jgi:hypothetical protein